MGELDADSPAVALSELSASDEDGQGDEPGQAGSPTQDPREPELALLWGLRRPRDETQLTQAIAAVGAADPGFAAAFVDLVLDAAELHGRTENVRELRNRGLPRALECRTEVTLREGHENLGRIDLRFEGEDFALLVENKLYSGYGHGQVDRYLRALRTDRSGLIAITRQSPTYGEREASEDPRWLGSIRWKHLLPRLRELPVYDQALRGQWSAFVDVLDQQGDLGVTRPNPDLIRAWARYLEGRKYLEDVLSEVWPWAEDFVRRELLKRYGHRGALDELAAVYSRGKKQQKVQRDQTKVYLGLRVPAKGPATDKPALIAQFNNYFGGPHFMVQAEPLDAEARMAANDLPLRAASDALQAQGFKTNGRWWARVHEPSDFIEADDLGRAVMAFIETDIPLIVDSGILDYNLDQGRATSVTAPSIL